MQAQATTRSAASVQEVAAVDREGQRRLRRERALRSALEKRAAGVPTYTVPEAAALLSVSQEHLYRLIHADAFPAVPMRAGLEGGRYVVAAADLEEFLQSGSGGGAAATGALDAAGGRS